MKFSPSPSSSHFLVCDSGRSVLISLAGESSDLDIQDDKILQNSDGISDGQYAKDRETIQP